MTHLYKARRECRVIGGVSILRIGIIVAVLCVLIGISIVDMRQRRIPDKLNAMLFLLGAGSGFLFEEISFVSRLGGAVAVSIPMLLVACIFRESIGGGDIKLTAAGGMLLGIWGNLFAVSSGLIFGGVYGAGLLLTKKARRKDSFALGPFLCVGIAAAFLMQQIKYIK